MASDVIASSRSTEVTKTSVGVKPIEYEFVRDNGKSGTITVQDSLLDTQARAEERANKEFLNNSFKQKSMSITTDKSDIKLNQIIEAEGLPFVVKSITVDISETKMLFKIGGIRYE